MGIKLQKFKLDPADDIVWYGFRCPACKERHFVSVDENMPNRNRHMRDRTWGFNGDMQKPTFEMSTVVPRRWEDGKLVQRRCHLYVRNGKLRYLMDCDHRYRSITVNMWDIHYWPEDDRNG